MYASCASGNAHCNCPLFVLGSVEDIPVVILVGMADTPAKNLAAILFPLLKQPLSTERHGILPEARRRSEFMEAARENKVQTDRQSVARTSKLIEQPT